jgi:uncharacterized protein (TIGR02118 family)
MLKGTVEPSDPMGRTATSQRPGTGGSYRRFILLLGAALSVFGCENAASGGSGQDGGQNPVGIKLVVLYPHPIDPEAFEAYYLSQHVPLMYGFQVATYRTLAAPAVAPEGKTPFYRVAEIPFRDVTHFNEFMQSEQAKVAVESAMKVSTGGPPVFVLCGEPDAKQ